MAGKGGQSARDVQRQPAGRRQSADPGFGPAGRQPPVTPRPVGTAPKLSAYGLQDLAALRGRLGRLALALGGALAFHPGEVEAEIGLPWPRPFSLAEEWLDEVPPRSWPDGRAAGARP